MTSSVPFSWESPSTDPNDETFGDVITSVDSETIDDYNAVLLGEPFDAAVIGRRGAAEGPGRIREALAGVKTHHFGNGPILDRNGEPVVSLGDLGDVDMPATADAKKPATADAKEPAEANAIDPATIQDAVTTVARDLHASDTLPVFLGGDNSLTYANVSPLIQDEKSVGVINFDAHLDVREVRDGPTSGTPYRQLFEAGLDAYCCVGARHFETSTAYARDVDDWGGEVVTAEAVGEDPDRALGRVRDAMAGVDQVVLSIDCDVLDATAAPGVSAPTPGGLGTRELFQLVRRLATRFSADERLAAVEVVECSPPLDEGDRTVDAAARIVAHVLSGAFSGEVGRARSNDGSTDGVGGVRR